MGQLTPTEDAQDLETRIQRAEMALIAREQRVRARWGALTQRAQRARDPALWVARWGPPVLGGVLAAGAAWWVWRRSGRRARTSDHHAADQADQRERASRHRHDPSSRGGRASRPLGWLEMLAIVWPLLPAAWHRRWGATSTAAMMNLGSVAARHLMQVLDRAREPEGPLPPLHTVAHVDLARYAGTWHEIARLPHDEENLCDGQPEARYALRGDGGVEVVNRCVDAEGREHVVVGEARQVPGGHGARLEVTFAPAWLRWLPWAWVDYCILHLDEGYTVALVGEPRRRQLWILARRPVIEPAVFDQLAAIAEAQGFPVDRLVLSAPPGPDGHAFDDDAPRANAVPDFPPG
ncbi:lipocalin family protein [Ideonella sp. DXS29W]|uniref:Lipocalin family protein n=1 Tax=Ideonella lacteola TaxID=2984193 RepID=A0ABU9BKJ3_9BURK